MAGTAGRFKEGNLPVHLESGPLVRDPSDARTLYAVYSLMPYAEVWRTALEGGNLLARVDPVSLAGGLAFVLLLMIGGGLLARWLAGLRCGQIDIGQLPAMTALRRRGWLAAAVVALATLAAAGLYLAWGGGGAPQFVEYAMPEPEDMPIGIAAAADGTVWFSIDGADAIGRVRDGQLERLPKPGKSVEPIGIAVAPDGSAWYTDIAAQVVSRMTPSGEVSSFRLDTPMVRLGRLAVAPDGAAWFAESSGHSITRLKDGRAHPPRVPVPARRTLRGGRGRRRHGVGDPAGGQSAAADRPGRRHRRRSTCRARGRCPRTSRSRRTVRSGSSNSAATTSAGCRMASSPSSRWRRRTPDSPGSPSPTTARCGSGCCAPAAWAGCAMAR